MAHIKQIWFHSSERENKEMQVYISLRPAGEVNIKVPIPRDFYDCVIQMAQAAADKQEQEMRAQILAETHTTDAPK